MVIIKYSDASIDTVFSNKNEMLEEVASRSIYCAKCGTLLDNDTEDGVMITCKFCGFKTPKMISQLEEE